MPKGEKRPQMSVLTSRARAGAGDRRQPPPSGASAAFARAADRSAGRHLFLNHAQRCPTIRSLGDGI